MNSDSDTSTSYSRGPNGNSHPSINRQQYIEFLHHLFVPGFKDTPVFSEGEDVSKSVLEYRSLLGRNSDDYLRADIMPLASSNETHDMRPNLLQGTRRSIMNAIRENAISEEKRSTDDFNVALVFYRWMSTVPEVQRYMKYVSQFADDHVDVDVYLVLCDLRRLKTLLESGLLNDVKKHVMGTVNENVDKLASQIDNLQTRFREKIHTDTEATAVSDSTELNVGFAHPMVGSDSLETKRLVPNNNNVQNAPTGGNSGFAPLSVVLAGLVAIFNRQPSMDSTPILPLNELISDLRTLKVRTDSGNLSEADRLRILQTLVVDFDSVKNGTTIDAETYDLCDSAIDGINATICNDYPGQDGCPIQPHVSPSPSTSNTPPSASSAQVKPFSGFEAPYKKLKELVGPASPKSLLDAETASGPGPATDSSTPDSKLTGEFSGFEALYIQLKDAERSNLRTQGIAEFIQIVKQAIDAPKTSVSSLVGLNNLLSRLQKLQEQSQSEPQGEPGASTSPPSAGQVGSTFLLAGGVVTAARNLNRTKGEKTADASLSDDKQLPIDTKRLGQAYFDGLAIKSCFLACVFVDILVTYCQIGDQLKLEDISNHFKNRMLLLCGKAFVNDVNEFGESLTGVDSFLHRMGACVARVLDHANNQLAVRFRLYCNVCYNSGLVILKGVTDSDKIKQIQPCLDQLRENIDKGEDAVQADGGKAKEFRNWAISFLPKIETHSIANKELLRQLRYGNFVLRDNDKSNAGSYCIDRGLCCGQSPYDTNCRDTGRLLDFNIGNGYPMDAHKKLLSGMSKTTGNKVEHNNEYRPATVKTPSLRWTTGVDFVDLGEGGEKQQSADYVHTDHQRSVLWLPSNEDASLACVYEHFIRSVSLSSHEAASYDAGRDGAIEVCCAAKLLSLPHLSKAKLRTVSNNTLRTRPCRVTQIQGKRTVQYPVYPGLEETPSEGHDFENDTTGQMPMSLSAGSGLTRFPKRNLAPAGDADHARVGPSKSRRVSSIGAPIVELNFGIGEPLQEIQPVYVDIGQFEVDLEEYSLLYDPPAEFTQGKPGAAAGVRNEDILMYDNVEDLRSVIDAAISSCETRMATKDRTRQVEDMRKAHKFEEQESERMSREKRQLVWNDALRESYICQDKLYAFVRQFSGTIGEPIESICNVDESKIAKHQADIRKKRDADEKRVSELHGKLIELFVSVLLKESGLSLAISPTDDVLRILPSLANKEAMDLLKKPSRDVGLFTNSRNLDALLKKGEGELSLAQLTEALKTTSNATLGAGVGMDVDDEPVESESLELLSAARNSLMLRYSTEAKAAMRKAYDLIRTECRCSHVYDCSRIPSAYELIEGDNSELTNAFAQLCAHVLVKHRMTSTSISAYVTRTSVVVNTQQVYMSLQKCIRAISQP